MFNSIRKFNSSSLDYKDTRILSFSINQTLYEISNLNEKWKWVRNTNGDVGLAPIDYLQQIQSSAKKQSFFSVEPEYKKTGKHDLNLDEGEQVEVVQGNSHLTMWLVRKLDGRRGLVPSFHLKAVPACPPLPSRLPSTAISQLTDIAPPLPSPHTHPLLADNSAGFDSLNGTAPNPLPTQQLPSPSQQIGSFELINSSDVGSDRYESDESPAVITSEPNSDSPSGTPETEPATSQLSHISTETATQLVEFVRTQAQVSFDSACLSVTAVIRFLRENDNFTPLSSQLSKLLTELDRSLLMEDTPIETEDERMIFSLSEIIQERVSDYQERSWEVLSDQHLVCEQVDTLIKIFQEGDPRAVRRAVSVEGCQLVSSLSAFYCGEKSPLIRLKLITALKILLALDTRYCSKLLVTTMASSLTNDLLNTRDDFRLGLEAARLGVYLFSSGEQIPIDLYESWSPELFSYIFSLMEDRLVLDVDESLPETLMGLLLSFNLHVSYNAFPFWNPLEVGDTRSFIDLLMLYLNRDIDPVKTLLETRAHSVLKMAENAVSNSVTLDLFDGSDLRILVDIGIRNILDLSHTHPLVPTYLNLLVILYRGVNCIRDYRVQELTTVCEKFNSLAKEDTFEYIEAVHKLGKLLI